MKIGNNLSITVDNQTVNDRNIIKKFEEEVYDLVDGATMSNIIKDVEFPWERCNEQVSYFVVSFENKCPDLEGFIRRHKKMIHAATSFTGRKEIYLNLIELAIIFDRVDVLQAVWRSFPNIVEYIFNSFNLQRSDGATCFGPVKLDKKLFTSTGSVLSLACECGNRGIVEFLLNANLAEISTYFMYYEKDEHYAKSNYKKFIENKNRIYGGVDGVVAVDQAFNDTLLTRKTILRFISTAAETATNAKLRALSDIYKFNLMFLIKKNNYYDLELKYKMFLTYSNDIEINNIMVPANNDARGCNIYLEQINPILAQASTKKLNIKMDITRPHINDYYVELVSVGPSTIREALLGNLYFTLSVKNALAIKALRQGNIILAEQLFDTEIEGANIEAFREMLSESLKHPTAGTIFQKALTKLFELDPNLSDETLAIFFGHFQNKEDLPFPPPANAPKLNVFAELEIYSRTNMQNFDTLLTFFTTHSQTFQFTSWHHFSSIPIDNYAIVSLFVLHLIDNTFPNLEDVQEAENELLTTMKAPVTCIQPQPEILRKHLHWMINQYGVELVNNTLCKNRIYLDAAILLDKLENIVKLRNAAPSGLRLMG